MSNPTKTGLVSFFDILGYTAFIENNDPKIAAVSINKFIDKIESFSDGIFINIFDGASKETIKPIAKRISHLIISDSILLTLECDKESDEYDHDLAVFLLYCSVFKKELFLFGLPLRGCIEYGEFYISKNTFAGKPIIDAYKASENLNLSGCLISENVSLDRMPTDGRDILYYKYLVPTKSGEHENYLLNFVIASDKDDECALLKLKDPRQFVVNSFSSHNKYLSLSANEKITNTEMFIRYCIARALSNED